VLYHAGSKISQSPGPLLYHNNVGWWRINIRNTMDGQKH